MKEFIKYQRLTILWALFVLIMCNADFGSVGKSHLFFTGFDKLVHCGFFFVFVVFCCDGFIRQQNGSKLSYKTAGIITLVAISLGGLTELLQLLVFTWRSADWNDFFADIVGACMGIFSILVTIGAIKYVKK
ncbi:VanZ family protein [Mucilaginibacter sp.]|uniref:VanZ family protein n=1 Tax=Mucilaginibacter sp. TaxID=1882438 RepID=UPI00262CBA37|nr:VanZ family protein [Mucilaginibacter sp.]MDB4925027.1 VanZ family protein [Mucilaginibacter sp.]